MKSFAIIGLGLFGTQLAKDLYNAGHNVLAIDSNEAIIEQIADHVSRAVTMDAKNRSGLAQLGISKYDCAVVGVSGDLATSVLVTMNLKALNVPQIVCKVQNSTDEEVLTTLGATACIVPEHIAANKMAKRLTSNHIIDFTQLSDDHSIMEMTTPASWIGKSIADLNIRACHGINVIGIRSDGRIRVDFAPTEPLKETDELIVIGRNKNLDKIQKIN